MSNGVTIGMLAIHAGEGETSLNMIDREHASIVYRKQGEGTARGTLRNATAYMLIAVHQLLGTGLSAFAGDRPLPSAVSKILLDESSPHDPRVPRSEPRFAYGMKVQFEDICQGTIVGKPTWAVTRDTGEWMYSVQFIDDGMLFRFTIPQSSLFEIPMSMQDPVR